MEPDDDYPVYEPKKESKLSVEEEYFQQHYLHQNLNEEDPADIPQETENSRKAKIYMKRYFLNFFSHSIKGD